MVVGSLQGNAEQRSRRLDIGATCRGLIKAAQGAGCIEIIVEALSHESERLVPITR